MSIIVGVLLACAAGLAGTLLCPSPEKRREGQHLAWAGAALLGSALFAFPLSARAGEILIGSATIIDGGNLVIADHHVRLYGVSAPDLDQTCWDTRERAYPCGRAAAKALTQRIGEAPVTCELPDAPSNITLTALCRVAGEDLGAWLVGQGYAMAERQDSHPYAEIAARAWGRRLGMWAGIFQDPDAWRQSHGSGLAAHLATRS